MKRPKHLDTSFEFPNFSRKNHKVTSDRQPRYNCIAYAAGFDNKWWWPVVHPDAFWPIGVPRVVTLEAFELAFASVGFEPCDDSSLEPSIEKIAIYSSFGKPTHAAKQLEDGQWSSKLGRNYDISHDLNAVDGPSYGTPVRFMKRQR